LEGKQDRIKSQVSKILSGTLYKTYVDSQEKEKASIRNGKAEQSQKRLKAAWKKEESGVLKRQNNKGGRE
jgi:hypothetical protein